MKRENPCGRISKDIRPGQSAHTTNNWLFTRTLYTKPLGFDHLQSYGARVLFTAVMVLNCTCTKAPSLQNHSKEQDTLAIHINSSLPYNHIDVFVFSDTLTRPLESHIRAGNSRFLKVPSEKGDKTVVALADVHGVFDGALPEKFSTMENLSMDYADENPEAPLQGGLCSTGNGETAELEIQPLLCPVVIQSICIEADAPLINATVKLERVNAHAEILRKDGFHPSFTLDNPTGLRHPLMMIREIPFDICSSPQEPGITLFCYPNEDDDGPGGGGTVLKITGTLAGQEENFRIPLGRIQRGAKLVLDIALKK